MKYLSYIMVIIFHLLSFVYYLSVIAKAAAPRTPALPPNTAFSIVQFSTNVPKHLSATTFLIVSITISPPLTTPPPPTTFSGPKLVTVLPPAIPT